MVLDIITPPSKTITVLKELELQKYYFEAESRKIFKK